MAHRELRERLEELVAHPREGLDVEVKTWLDLDNKLHAARLAKEAMALANHGSGYILIGFDDKGVPRRPSEPRPVDLQHYNQDKINGIINRYAEPEFHCSVEYVRYRETGELYPVILVPGRHRAPIRAKSNGPGGEVIRIGEVYIRAPGPETKRAETVGEWDELWARCRKAAESYHGFQQEPEPAPVTETRRVPVSREELQRNLNEDRRAVLDAIWGFWRERNEWIPRVKLTRQFIGGIGTAGVQAAIDGLPQPIVCPNWEGGTERHALTFAGILLADQGKEVEPLMVRYLQYIKDRFLAEEDGKIKSRDVAAALDLSPDEAHFLGRIVHLSPFRGTSSSLGSEEWDTDPPHDVDELAEAEDVQSFLWNRALWNVAWVEEIPVWEGVEWGGLHRRLRTAGLSRGQGRRGA
jgi:hypothetical protein